MAAEEYIFEGSQDSGYETDTDCGSPSPEAPSSIPTLSPTSSDDGT
jgi:hypothetical protein